MKTQLSTVFFSGALALLLNQIGLAASKSETKPKSNRKVLTDAELIRSLPAKSATANKKKNVIYKWLDEDGNTVISDKPHQGAVEIKLPKIQTYTPVQSVEGYRSGEKQLGDFKKQAEPFDSTPPVIKIVSPANDSWLDNNLGSAEISVNIEPGLGLGQQLVIKLDNKIISKGISSTVSVKELDRGTHTLSAAVVIKKTGKVIIQQQTTFHVRRPFIKR